MMTDHKWKTEWTLRQHRSSFCARCGAKFQWNLHEFSESDVDAAFVDFFGRLSFTCEEYLVKLILDI